MGVDLWRRADQSGNSAEATRRNAVAEGVADRVELYSADMRALPFKDDSFDVVVSSLAIHNIPGRAGREKAIEEAVRVLRPGGRILVADVRGTRRPRICRVAVVRPIRPPDPRGAPSVHFPLIFQLFRCSRWVAVE